MKFVYKNILRVFFITALIGLITGCVSTKLPESYTVQPEVLEATGGTVNFTVNGTVPPKSFHKKAKVEFIPYIQYGDQRKDLEKFTLRGEKTEGEGTVISSKTGGSFTYNASFDYESDMRVAELRTDARVIKGSKVQEFKGIKLADGIINTYQNVAHTERTIEAPSGYERETIISKKATVYFPQNIGTINWNLKLNKDEKAVQAFEELDGFLMKGWQVRDIAIDGWASPEGEISFNDNLAVDRAENTRKYMERKMKKVFKKRAKELGVDVSEIEQEVKYIANGHGEDWDGFMKSVQESNLPDKNTILNVINSQSDVTLREQEIRNMTVIYKEVEEMILPPLRRAEVTVNCFEPKRTDDEIARLAVTAPDSLTYEELLHAATLTDDHQAKYNIYRSGFAHPGRDWKTFNNAGVEAVELGHLEDAALHLGQAAKLAPGNGLIENNLGVVAARNGDYQQAETHFLNAQKAGEDVGYNLGVVAIQKGEYAKAINYFKGVECDYNLALSQVLAGNMDDAMKNLKCAPVSAQNYYLLAVIGARTGKGEMVFDYLAKAIEKDPSMKEMARDDREFVKYFDNDAFKALVE
ncbi:MAG: tetratricopeptide repeat protein [Bacteroidales bacterium]